MSGTSRTSAIPVRYALHPPGLFRRAALGGEAAERRAFKAGGDGGFEAGDADGLRARDESETPRVRDADAQAGETAGAGDNTDTSEFAERDARLGAEFGDESRQAALLAARHRLAPVSEDFTVLHESGFHRAESGVEA